MPLRPACFSRTFSGLRSQWISRLRNNKSRQRRMECANFRTSGTPKPWTRNAWNHNLLDNTNSGALFRA